MSAHLKAKLRLGEADVEKFRLVKDQPLESCRLGGGLADGGADVDRVGTLGVRRHHVQVDRRGGGSINCFAVETPLVRERPGPLWLDPQHDVGVDADDRLDRGRRSRHGDVCAADELGVFRRANRRQDGVEDGGLAARVPDAIADHHLVAAHVFRLIRVNRICRCRRSGDVLFFKPPLIRERRGALDLHRLCDRRAELHDGLVNRLLRDHRRVVRLKRHEPPPRAPPVALVVLDVFLLGVSCLGIHLDGPHVGVVVGIDLRGAVVAPAVAAVGTQLHIRGNTGLEQRRLAHIAQRIGRLAIGKIGAGIGVLGEAGVANQHIAVFVHRHAGEGVLLDGVGVLDVAALDDRRVRLEVPPLNRGAVDVLHAFRQKDMVGGPKLAVALGQGVHARVVREDFLGGRLLRGNVRLAEGKLPGLNSLQWCTGVIGRVMLLAHFP